MDKNLNSTGCGDLTHTLNRKQNFTQSKIKIMKANINNTGKILKEISTHKAVKVGDKIKIYIKGFEIEDLKYNDELIYTIPADNVDDLLPMFELFEENNRINLNEFLNS